MSFITFLYFRLQAIFCVQRNKVMLKSIKVLKVQVTDNLIFLWISRNNHYIVKFPPDFYNYTGLNGRVNYSS